MKLIKYYMLFLLLLSNIISNGQNLKLLREYGKFTSANSFSINNKGILYISDSGTNEIIKIDTLGNIMKSIGGYGSDEYSFDEPSDIFATTLNIFVADKNNDRIQIYDKDLNFISSFSSDKNEINNYTFRYPSSVAIFSQGDFFVLDSDNIRILKFNSRGKFQNEIGGITSSTYSLTNPKKITINDNGELSVIEFTNLISFDQFGNFLNKFELDFEPTNINCISNLITIVSQNKIAFLNSKDVGVRPIINKIDLVLKEEITDAVIFNSKLYVLTTKKIQVFELTD